MVKVACKVVNGLLIQKWKEGYDDGTGDGVKNVVRDGTALRLNGPSSLGAGAGNPSSVGDQVGVTEIPDDWRFGDWLKQNEQNPFVTEGFVYVIEEPEVPNAP